MPVATGSPTSVKTMGILCVASLAASVAGSLLVKIKSTPALTRSCAAAGVAPGSPLVKRIVEARRRGLR